MEVCSCGSSGQEVRIHGANMRPIWGRQDPGGPQVGPMNSNFCVPVTGSFPSQRSSYVESVSIPWCLHVTSENMLF